MYLHIIRKCAKFQKNLKEYVGGITDTLGTHALMYTHIYMQGQWSFL